MWFVYILLCKDGSLYTGATNNIIRRFQEHQSGDGGSYTRSHPPHKIVYKEKVGDRGDALRREAVIKRMRRSAKLELIRFHRS